MTTKDTHYTKYKPLILITLFLSVIIFVWAAMWEYASVKTLSSRHLMSGWTASDGITDTKEISAAMEGSQMSLYLNPYSADYVLDIANIYEWQAKRHPVWSEDAHNFRNQALELYREATLMRPSWGFVWAQLAHSKMLNQNLDEETFMAFEKAMIMAPWRPETQRKVIWVGILIWDHLPLQQKEQALKTVERSISNWRLSDFIIKIAVHLNWEDNLLPLLKKEWQHESLKNKIKRRERQRGLQEK